MRRRSRFLGLSVSPAMQTCDKGTYHRGTAMTGLLCCRTRGCMRSNTGQSAKSAVNHFRSHGLGFSSSARRWSCKTACFEQVKMHRGSERSGRELRVAVRHCTRKKLRGSRSAGANETLLPRGAAAGLLGGAKSFTKPASQTALGSLRDLDKAYAGEVSVR